MENDRVYHHAVVMGLMTAQRLQGNGTLETAVLELLGGLPASLWTNLCKRLQAEPVRMAGGWEHPGSAGEKECGIGLSAGLGGIRAAIRFDAGKDAGVAGQRPARGSALESESSRRAKKCGAFLAQRREEVGARREAQRRDGGLKMDWTKPGRFGWRIAYTGIEWNRPVLFRLAGLAGTLNIPLPCGHSTAGAPGLRLS